MEPRFAVVGHPNKGKSSIVATLARDDRVRIAPDPGTTRAANAYPMQLDGRTLYTLIDTPGFQRARRVLAWLKTQADTAAERPAAVRAFVETPAHAERYPDEVALLGPIVGVDPVTREPTAPAGVLYVVDGSRPYGPEYEPEMEVLRWTGQPGMALINPIHSEAHVDEWRDALGQFFGTVRVFDAVDAEWAKRLELLRAFGSLKEGWSAPLTEAAAALEADRDERRAAADRRIAEMVVAAMRLQVTRKLPPGGDADAVKDELNADYREAIRKLEVSCRDAVEAIYGFVEVVRDDAELNLAQGVGGDLFNAGTWMRFGLTRGDLVKAGALAGAAAGGWFDVATGLGSFGMGALAGGVIGGATAYFGTDRLTKVRVLSQSVGGVLAACGPARDVNLAYVLLGRARLHHDVIARRTHARRDALTAADLDAASIEWTKAERDAVAKALRPVMKDREDDAAAAEAVRKIAAL